MNWSEQWRAIEARIAALGERGRLAFQSAPSVGSDYHGTVTQGIIQEGKELFALVNTLDAEAGANFPAEARRCIVEFRQQFQAMLHPGAQRLGGWPGVQVVLDAFLGLRARLSFHLASTQVIVRSATERALVHLQRSLVVDSELRARWVSAFEDGEVAIERLGSVQLLQHGVWGFKVNSKGERTDLRAESEFDRQCDQGLLQARLYSQGSLAGFELSDTRYIVAVSRAVGMSRAPFEDGGVTFRFINVQLEPRTPSHSPG